MKKFLSLAIALIMILGTVLMGSCDSSTNNSTITNNSNNTPTQTTTEHQTEKPPHTEHEGNGTCSVCDIDYYDELVSYIKNNSTETTEHKNNTNYFIKKTIGKTTYKIGWYSNDDHIEIGTEMNDGYWGGISIRKSSVKYHEYKWYCYDGYTLNSAEGLINASGVSPDSSVMLTVASSEMSSSKTGSAQQHMGWEISTIINEILIPMIEECNLTPSDFGFERFE